MHVIAARLSFAGALADGRDRSRRLRAAELQVAITYLGRQEPPPIPLSLVEPILTDEGMKGAQQGMLRQPDHRPLSQERIQPERA